MPIPILITIRILATHLQFPLFSANTKAAYIGRAYIGRAYIGRAYIGRALYRARLISGAPMSGAPYIGRAYVGRAYIYGLGAMGQAGVTRALEVIHKELDVSMALCGRRDVRDLDRDILMIPEGFEGRWQA